MTRQVIAAGAGTSPAGPPGKDGTNGIDGLPGVNAIPAKDAVDAYNAALIDDDTSATAKRLTASNVGGLYDDNTGKPNGSITTADSGHAWAVTGPAGGAIRGGLMTLAAGQVGASYARTSLGKVPVEVGGVIQFGAGSTNGSDQTILVTPDASLNSIPVHFVTGPTMWILHSKTGDDFKVLASGSYTAIPTDERRTVAVGLNGNTVVLRLADGGVRSVTIPGLATALGGNPFVIFETLTAASTDRLGGWVSVYAADAAAPRTRGALASAATALDVNASKGPPLSILNASDLPVDGYGFRTVDLSADAEVFFLAVDIDFSLNFTGAKGPGQRFQVWLGYDDPVHTASASGFIRGGGFATPTAGKVVGHDFTIGNFGIARLTNSSAAMDG